LVGPSAAKELLGQYGTLGILLDRLEDTNELEITGEGTHGINPAPAIWEEFLAPIGLVVLLGVCPYLNLPSINPHPPPLGTFGTILRREIIQGESKTASTASRRTSVVSKQER